MEVRFVAQLDCLDLAWIVKPIVPLRDPEIYSRFFADYVLDQRLNRKHLRLPLLLDGDVADPAMCADDLRPPPCSQGGDQLCENRENCVAVDRRRNDRLHWRLSCTQS